jgi:hypothetical protein
LSEGADFSLSPPFPLRSWVKKLLKETRNEIYKKGYEPSKEGPEHDDMGDEMMAAKKAAEAKYGGKVRLCFLPFSSVSFLPCRGPTTDM